MKWYLKLVCVLFVEMTPYCKGRYTSIRMSYLLTDERVEVPVECSHLQTIKIFPFFLLRFIRALERSSLFYIYNL